MKYYTHAGFFHADEVTGYATCRLAGVADHPIRLTTLTEIPADGIVADIGREYDPGKQRFDHHQGLFPRAAGGIPLASAGMLWGQYGKYAVVSVLGNDDGYYDSDPTVQAIADRVDETFIQGIDAHDADSAYHAEASCSAGKVRLTTISNAGAMLNTEDTSDHEAQYDAFLSAAAFIQSLLVSSIKCAKSG